MFSCSRMVLSCFDSNPTLMEVSLVIKKYLEIEMKESSRGYIKTGVGESSLTNRDALQVAGVATIV